MAGYLKCFIFIPHSFIDNNSSLSGVKKENFSICQSLSSSYNCDVPAQVPCTLHHTSEKLLISMNLCLSPLLKVFSHTSRIRGRLQHDRCCCVTSFSCCRGNSKDSAVTSAIHSHPKQHSRCWVGRLNSLQQVFVPQLLTVNRNTQKEWNFKSGKTTALLWPSILSFSQLSFLLPENIGPLELLCYIKELLRILEIFFKNICGNPFLM